MLYQSRGQDVNTHTLQQQTNNERIHFRKGKDIKQRLRTGTQHDLFGDEKDNFDLTGEQGTLGDIWMGQGELDFGGPSNL